MTTIPDQPAPVPNEGTPVWELVIRDMQERDQVGRERYGTPLQTNNGRDALVDAYQEGLDLVVYLRQAIEEREEQRRLAAAAAYNPHYDAEGNYIHDPICDGETHYAIDCVQHMAEDRA